MKNLSLFEKALFTVVACYLLVTIGIAIVDCFRAGLLAL